MNNNLKQLREIHHISISELARKVKVSERYLRFIESGNKNPSLKTAQKIAAALESTTDEIFLTERCTKSTLEGGSIIKG